MKLEVGQKIVIYEALTDGGFSHKTFEQGCTYLGFNSKTGVNLLSEDNGFLFMYNSEVRKVGSLIIKSIK